jgi:CO dehydrogenase/acetyl-CoA synthase beta subunit
MIGMCSLLCDRLTAAPDSASSYVKARVWSNLPHEIRDKWHQSAEEEKEDLLRHFPDYKYQPVHDKGKRAQKKKKEEERKVKRTTTPDSRKAKHQQAVST